MYSTGEGLWCRPPSEKLLYTSWPWQDRTLFSPYNVNLYVQWSVCMRSSFCSWPSEVPGIKCISVKFPTGLSFVEGKEAIFAFGGAVGAKPTCTWEDVLPLDESPSSSCTKNPLSPVWGYPSVMLKVEYCVKFSISPLCEALNLY